MRAMVLERAGEPLRSRDAPDPEPSAGQVRIRVLVCGVCRTDVHIVDGELLDPALPLVPGHQIVGVVEAVGDRVEGVAVGDRVGVPWLGWACGECRYCATGRQNLCERALFTGYQLDGGYAETTVADARACLALPDAFPNVQASPQPLDAAILFAAAGELVPRALEAVEAGGTVVCAEIHMSDIPSFPYELLWKERVLRSVANLTWVDGREFLAVAAGVPVRTRVTTFPLDQANEALAALRGGGVNGAIVLQVAT